MLGTKGWAAVFQKGTAGPRESQTLSHGQSLVAGAQVLGRAGERRKGAKGSQTETPRH